MSDARDFELSLEAAGYDDGYEPHTEADAIVRCVECRSASDITSMRSTGGGWICESCERTALGEIYAVTL